MLFSVPSCVSTSHQNKNITETLHTAITHQKVTKENLIYHLVTIQLNHDAISIVATPPEQENAFETIGKTTNAFAKENNAIIAINASPFSYPLTRFSPKRNIEGLYIYEGNSVSSPLTQYAALCFTEDKKAFIVNSQTDKMASDAYFAFGGFWTILENNEILQFQNIQDARTAIGISEDGFTLYILNVEKNNHSFGLNYMECAKILQNAGATKAMQFDGGGSSSLILPHTNTNSVHSNRKVANNLGFKIDVKN